jgi:hypothetical protein
MGTPPQLTQGMPGSHIPSGDINSAYIGFTSFVFIDSWWFLVSKTTDFAFESFWAKTCSTYREGLLLYKSFYLSSSSSILIYKEKI